MTINRLLLAVWVLLIIGLSIAPFDVKLHLGTMGRWHNAGHFFGFFVATVLACRTVNSAYAKIICGLGIAGVAFGMEWVEKVSTHNFYEWHDVLTDCTGIVFGLLLMLLLPPNPARDVKRAA